MIFKNKIHKIVRNTQYYKKIRNLNALIYICWNISLLSMQVQHLQQLQQKKPTYYLIASYVKNSEINKKLEELSKEIERRVNGNIKTMGLKFEPTKDSSFHVSYYGAVPLPAEEDGVIRKRCGLVVKKAIEDYKCQGSLGGICNVNNQLKTEGKYNTFIVLEFNSNCWIKGLQRKIEKYSQDSCFMSKWPNGANMHISLGEIRFANRDPHKSLDQERAEVSRLLNSYINKGLVMNIVDNTLSHISHDNREKLNNLSLSFDSITVVYGKQYHKEYSFH